MMRNTVWTSRGTFAAAICVVALLIACNAASAAPLVVYESGEGHVHVSNLSGPDGDKMAAISVGTGSLSAGGGQLNLTSAALSWNNQLSDTSAVFVMDLDAFGGIGGNGLSEATLHFNTPLGVAYSLVVHPREYGNATTASIDTNTVGYTFNFQNPEPRDEKSETGSLPGGEHTFVVSTFAGQTRSNPLLSDVTVTLTLSPAAVSVPLPAAVYPGGAVLIALAGIAWRRRRAV
jgi:hypothetical protein